MTDSLLTDDRTGTGEAASSRRWWVLLTVGVGTFMSALDGSVVNTVLPLMRAELHATVAAIEWVTTVYLLVVSALLLGVGRAGDIYGYKRSYLAGFCLFVAGSALCGLSGSVGMLVAMRALQAFGAALLFASSPAILTTSFPPTQRGRALGIQAMMTYLGLSVGPPLGGWLAGAFGWPAVFYINLPVGALAIGLALRFVVDDRPARARERFDWTGALLFSTGLVVLLLALNQGHAWGWLAAPTLGLLAAAAVALGLFVRVEAAQRSPMLDLTLFRSGTFSSATASALLSYVCSYAVIFVLPFLLVQGRGLSTARAGVVLAAQPVVMAVVAPISGILSDRIGSRLLTSTGMMVLGAGLALLALLTAAGSSPALAGGLAVVGLGFGLFSSPNNSALMGAAPRHRQGIASGVLATARNVGMVLGVGLTGAILTTFLARGASGLVGGVRASLLVSAGVAVVAGVVSMKR